MSLGPLPPIANMLRVVISGVVDGTATPFPWANVLHFSYSGGLPSNADCATIAGQVGLEWSGHMAAECPSPTSLTRVVVTDLSSSSAGEGQDTTVHVGTRGDDSIPANAAFLISYPVQGRYRGGHPRQYLYVLGNADLLGAAEWSTAATAEVIGHWNGFLDNVIGISAGSTLVGGQKAIRYYGKFLPNDGPPRYRLVTPQVLDIVADSGIAHQEIASQRRRVGRRKR